MGLSNGVEWTEVAVSLAVVRVPRGALHVVHEVRAWRGARGRGRCQARHLRVRLGVRHLRSPSCCCCWPALPAATGTLQELHYNNGWNAFLLMILVRK
jgi:hypothetical protein